MPVTVKGITLLKAFLLIKSFVMDKKTSEHDSMYTLLKNPHLVLCFCLFVIYLMALGGSRVASHLEQDEWVWQTGSFSVISYSHAEVKQADRRLS